MPIFRCICIRHWRNIQALFWSQKGKSSIECAYYLTHVAYYIAVVLADADTYRRDSEWQWNACPNLSSCHHWQCEFPTSKQKSELSKSSQKTSRCWRQHVRISTWWPAMPIILFAIPILHSHTSDYNMFNCFPRLYSEPIRPACCPVTTPAYQLHAVSAECKCAWPVSAYSH